MRIGGVQTAFGRGPAELLKLGFRYFYTNSLFLTLSKLDSSFSWQGHSRTLLVCGSPVFFHLKKVETGLNRHHRVIINMVLEPRCTGRLMGTLNMLVSVLCKLGLSGGIELAKEEAWIPKVPPGW